MKAFESTSFLYNVKSISALLYVNVKKCKLIITVVSAFSYPRYCLSTDQLVYRRATQTAEINIGNEK